ncbi:MAG TPA: lipid A deacylase LpxR family protein [Gemmatimonadaceae bacterium]|nr:lipid A deacylase LpxR family protein [Gemmatimonadaceae bacterium]
MTRAAVILALALGAGSSAVAQTPAPPATSAGQSAAQKSRIQPPWRMSVRADNDAFNFWRAVTDRPDKEYTNGDEVELELAAAPLWGKRFASGSAPCTGTEAAGERCLMTSFSIAQKMYTPAPGREPRVVPDWADDRPYAAWLYASAAARVLEEKSLRVVKLEVGVTGPPAAGEFAQRTAHQLTGVYSRDPVGWDTQIGFEVGAVASVRETRRFVARTGRGRPVLDFMPHAGASVGNVLTAGEAGFTTRLGFNLSNPWWTSEWRTRPPFEIYLLGGARAEAVARNITLDGNTLGAERRVERVPLVGEYSVGLGVRNGGFVASWRAVTRSKEYATGPKAHAFSVLFAGFEVPARRP